MSNKSPRFLERLKNHHIFRVATVYAVGAWVLIQACNSIFPDIGLSKQSVRLVITLVAFGFPVVLALAWMLIKPPATDPVKLSRWQRFHWTVGSLLSITVIALVTVSGWYLWKLGAYTTDSTQAIAVSAVNAGYFSPPSHSIAVLPFANLSNDSKQQYFCDGITEELTDALGRVAGMEVIAWQSATIYRNSSQSLKAIGKSLNVASVLVGSIMRDGNMLRVSAELVNTQTGYQLWSSHYDRELKDVFAIQDDISRSIIDALQVQLAGSSPLVVPATTNLSAYDAYLRGLAAFNLRTAAGLKASIKDFTHATRLDPDYAGAYASLAHAYYLLHQYTPVSLKISLENANQAARKALGLNADLVEAHVVLGLVYFTEHKKELANDELRLALRLDPNSYAAHQAYGFFMFPTRGALTQFKMAAALDPAAPIAWIDIANTYADLGDYPHALEALTTALPLAPSLTYIALDMAYLHHLMSDDKKAIAMVTGIKPQGRLQTSLVTVARLTYGSLLDSALKDHALAAANKIDADRLGQVDAEQLATYYQLLGQKDRAVHLVAQLCANGPEYCSDIAQDPHYLLLRSEPAFRKLADRYGTIH